jgi:cytochrome c oxidase cbb3-type subunit 3
MRGIIFTIFASFLLIQPIDRTFQKQEKASEETKEKSKIDPAAGKAIFQQHCALCHGHDGGGGRGPDLRRPKLNRAADDAALKSLIENGIPPEMPEGWYMSPEDIGNVAAFVRTLGNVPQETLPGNPERGAEVYGRSGCSGCHILAGNGTGFGPELTEVGARRGSARLRETLRNPSKTMPDGFLMVEVLTASGEKIQGIRLNEDSFTIQVKNMMGKTYSLRKSELRDLKKLRDETPMPSYEEMLSSADLDDLVAFLAAQRGRP